MAIAFDAATNGGNVVPGTSLTYSHTCTGSDLLLFVEVRENVAAPTHITGITYNSVALASIATNANGDASELISLWYLAGPATGAHDVVVTAGSSTTFTSAAISYTGCAQTC